VGASLYRKENGMFHYGVDYYPEHWPEERWGEDACLMQDAGITIVRLAEFAWGRLEPREGQVDFDWLDRAIDTLAARKIKVLLGTPTASPPPWLMAAHPDMFIVWVNGVRATYGSRRPCCPSNATYRDYSARITRAMAEHYKDHPHVIGWQIDNEFGDRCYCLDCQRAFHAWLQREYGTLDELNTRWGTVFWSHVYTDWSQIPLPWSTSQPALSTNATVVANPSLALDYYRFMSDTYVEYQQVQVEILRELCPRHLITHNLMGFSYDKLNYFDLAEPLDLVSWNSYPRNFWSKQEQAYPGDLALGHATMRSLKQCSFWMMEQQSGTAGWDVMGTTPRPGEIRLWAYQAIAHGADGILYFRWRSSRFGTEQYWHGVLDHDGRPRRRYEEVRHMGQELARIGNIIAGAKVQAETALILSYDSRFAFQIQPNNAAFSYADHLASYYRALHRLHVAADVISPQADLSPYKLVIAPALHVLDEDTAERLASYAEKGGVLVVTARSGVKDPTNLVVNLALPGLLAELCGVEVAEYDSLSAGRSQPLEFVSPQLAGEDGTAAIWCDVLETQGAEVVACYTQDYFRGRPALTLHRVGRGHAIYVGTVGDQDLADTITRWALGMAGVQPFLEVTEGVEIARRWQGDRPILFLLNHSTEERRLTLPGPYVNLLSGTCAAGEVSLAAKDVLILIEAEK
jgi:beta-galactosidase